MKTTIILTTLLSFNAFAGNFNCQDDYEKRIRAIEKRQDLGIQAVSGVSAGCFLLYPLSIGAIGTCLSGAVVLLGGVAGTTTFVLQPGRNSFLNTYGSLVEAQSSREEFLFVQAEAFELIKKNDDMLAAIQVKPYLEQKSARHYGKYDESKGRTFIDNLAEELKVSYEDVARAIQENSSDDTFCPNGKELKFKTFKKTLQRILRK